MKSFVLSKFSLHGINKQKAQSRLCSPEKVMSFVTQWKMCRESPWNELSVQFSRSVVSDSLWPHGLQHARHPCASPTPRACSLTSFALVMPSNHFILCHPLLLLPSIFPSIRVFSKESVLPIRWPEQWSFSIGPSSEYSGLISFRIDWLDLLTVQWTLKSLLQHYSSKASILGASAFLMVQLSHPYMTTGNTIALTMDLCWQSNVTAI